MYNICMFIGMYVNLFMHMRKIPVPDIFTIMRCQRNRHVA